MYVDFPGGSDGKVSVYNARDQGSIPGSGRSAGEGNGNPLQSSCLENPLDRGAWWATVHRVVELDTTERLHFNVIQCANIHRIISEFSQIYLFTTFLFPWSTLLHSIFFGKLFLESWE